MLRMFLSRPRYYYVHIGACIASSLLCFNASDGNMAMCSSEDKERFGAEGIGTSSTMFSLLLNHVKSRSNNEDQKLKLGQEVGLGFTLGVTSGFALKKAARTILFTVRDIITVRSHPLKPTHSTQSGMFFGCLQLMQSQGWIEVKFENIQDSLARRVDFDNQKLDGESLDERQRDILLLLESGVPCGSAFTAGLLLGFRL
jgi:uncharacterized membrane protein (Fun14 family)